MVSKDSNKSPPIQKVHKSGSTNFHKARQLFESISKSTEHSSENIHSSTSDLPLKKSLNASVSEFEIKLQPKTQKPSVISIFQNANRTSKDEKEQVSTSKQEEVKTQNISELNNTTEKVIAGKPPIIPKSSTETKTPASQHSDKASEKVGSHSSSSSQFISANSSVHSLDYQSSPTPLSPSLNLIVTDSSVENNYKSLNFVEELGQTKSPNQVVIPNVRKDSLPLNTEKNTSNPKSNFSPTTENPSKNPKLIPHLTYTNPSPETFSQKVIDGIRSTASSLDNKTPTLSTRVTSNSYASPSLTRISCLNPKDLEPSLSSVLETIELEDSSAQSSTRHSADLSVYSDTPTLELQQELPIFQSNSLGASVVPLNPNNMGGLVFDKIISRFPNYSETSSPLTESPKSFGHIRTSSHNSEPSNQNINKNRPGSIVSYFSADVVPSPPPKSHLRSLHSQSKKKEITDEKNFKQSLSSTQGHIHNKTLTRKLSDPETFAKGLSSSRPHIRSASNRVYSRAESSSTSPPIDANNISSTVPETQLPIRNQSLDHLKSNSEETVGTQSTKQTHIIDEILSTESAYLMDLILLKEIYLEGATSREDIFSPRDLKLIFINLEEIISFSESFLSELRLNNRLDPSPQIGNVFVSKHKDLQSVYSQYFKMHEVSTAHLQDMQSTQPLLTQFLESCDEILKKRSKSWDLPSLLIKPIQRVLKYPLLLKELLDVTDKSNKDYDDLVTASILIKGTADYYNELKRRKDVIDRIIGPKSKKQELHIRAELNKKFFRGAQHLKKIAGIKNKTVDTVYDSLAQKFHIQETMLRRFWDEVQMWTLAVEESYNIKDRQARAFLALYAPPVSSSTVPGSIPHHHHHLFSAEFCKLTSNLAREMVSFLNHEVYTVLFEKINQLIRLFNTPALLMKKRDRKLFDYDSLSNKEGSKNKGNINDSAQAYQLINKELINELPLFLNLSQEMFTILVAHFAWIQREVYRRAAQQLARLLVAFERPHNLDDNIVRLFNSHSLGEGILDPFVKATHALLASTNPKALSARISRSLSSETVPQSKNNSPSNVVSGRSDSTQSARLSRSPATYLSPRRGLQYPGIPPQFYDSYSETSSFEIKPKSDIGNESEPHEDEIEDDNTSISALDGSFLLNFDQGSRRDHLLADLDPGLFNLPLFPGLESDSCDKSIITPLVSPPQPNHTDSSVLFNSLRGAENHLSVKLSPTSHSKSSSSPEKAILRDLEKAGIIGHSKGSKKDDMSYLSIDNNHLYRPSDQESQHSSSASEKEFKNSILLSRHCSRTSTNENYPRSIMSFEENGKGLDNSLKILRNGSAESLNSNYPPISKFPSYDSGSSSTNKLSKTRTDQIISNGLDSVTGSMKSSHRNSTNSTSRSKNKPRPVLFECKAVFPYSAASDTELSLVPGMELRVFKCSTTTSCPWWYGEDIVSNNRGWFPSSFCKNTSNEK